MKIELKKKTGLLGDIDYFIYIDGSAVDCLSTLEEATEKYNEYIERAKEPVYETIKSETI